MAVRTAPTLTTTTETTVKLSPKARQMVKARCEEHANLARQVAIIKGTKAKPGRMKRIEHEVDEIFTKEKQGKALLDGVSLDGYRIKMVEGSRKKFDQVGFMKKHGLGQADFDEFTTEEPNEPYIKITGPGEKDDE